MLAERVLPLSGIHNFRDYGGYAVEGGGRLRDAMLWRSAHHEAATDDDLAMLDQLGIETVIDLRGDDERAMHPCRRSDNFSARVLFAGGVTAGLAPHLQAAGGGDRCRNGARADDRYLCRNALSPRARRDAAALSCGAR